MKTFEQYLRDASGADVIDFRLRATSIAGQPTTFYVHPLGKDGETLDFTVIGNALVPNSAAGLDFGAAIQALKAGKRVARAGWNGKGMWIVYMSGMSLPPFSTQGTDRKVNDRTAKWIGEDTPLETLPYIAMWTVNAEGRRAWLPGWVASQSDMLADDWTVVG
ncbi:DUF2829 domain-containing protein [Azospirillum doebereinerae]|uniref:DUF2829 domain-containing protein n=1 Tax=Azospirillum doebereinerae TaxID=92933 RepID=UPI001EE6297B|nr:DUF2829 domain-containing protein [Azospirillum doebereinerae]MCG5241386.1 DUF2829 domain-containing protein [Azospirillum doebereinerae]